MSNCRLLFYNIRGKAQVIRLFLHDHDVPFTDDVINHDDWPAMKPQNLPFGQIPVFWDGDLCLAQTGAILRYLSRIHDTYGSNDKEAALIDMAYEGVDDFFLRYVRFACTNFDAGKDAFLAETLPNDILPVMKKLLMTNKNGEGFLVGEKISFADYHLFQFLDALTNMSSTCLDSFPVLKAYHERIKARPKISAFLASDLNMGRTVNSRGH